MGLLSGNFLLLFYKVPSPQHTDARPGNFLEISSSTSKGIPEAIQCLSMLVVFVILTIFSHVIGQNAGQDVFSS